MNLFEKCTNVVMFQSSRRWVLTCDQGMSNRVGTISQGYKCGVRLFGCQVAMLWETYEQRSKKGQT